MVSISPPYIFWFFFLFWFLWLITFLYNLHHPTLNGNKLHCIVRSWIYGYDPLDKLQCPSVGKKIERNIYIKYQNYALNKKIIGVNQVFFFFLFIIIHHTSSCIKVRKLAFYLKWFTISFELICSWISYNFVLSYWSNGNWKTGIPTNLSMLLLE